MLKNNENGVAWETGRGTELKDPETIREENICERSWKRKKEEEWWQRPCYSMKLEAVCYIQQVRIFSLLANVTN